MNHNILLSDPKVKFERHQSMSPDFPFVFHTYIARPRGIFSLHESFELLYFLEGSGYILYDGVRHPVRKGDLVAVNSYSLHQVVTDSEAPHYCVIVSRAFCQTNSFDPCKLTFQHVIRDDPQATALFHQVMESYANETEGFRSAGVKCAVLTLLLHLCRHYSTPRGEDSSANSPALEQVRRAIGFMKANLHHKLTVDDIAANAGVSKYHFLRQFKRITGQTPTHYLNALRCEQARNLLESGDCTVKEAACQCGFPDTSYFARVFRQYIGLLPSQIRPEP